jgi:subtilisin family serine protease
MDPALWELLRAEVDSDRDRVIEAIIRLARPGIEIPDVRIVSQFGAIATCRIPARDVVAVRARSDVISVKAARALSEGVAPTAAPHSPIRPTTQATDVRRSPELTVTGTGVIVAAVDWGADLDAAAFRHPPDSTASLGGDSQAGDTRFLSFWDQRDLAIGPRPEPYGYGAVHDRDEINRALQDPRPYDRLGYHPAIADRGTGTHGMHVLDIAAGNGRGGGPLGIAPQADLLFVHLADRDTGGLANLGDSVRLLEAVDFIAHSAGSRPWVINISVGRHGGPHDGTTLTELAFDALLAEAPGRFIVQSTGNYFRSRTHACGILASGEAQSFSFISDPLDATPNELEIWYDGADEFVVRIDPPEHTGGPPVALGERADLLIEGRVVGRVYHRAAEPNNGDNHIDVFLYPIGCAGTWTVTLEARHAVNGRFDAWLERDDACRRCQARFTRAVSDRSSTTGTIANSHLPLVVGAYDGHDPARPAASFSSAGPTRDGRGKPDLAAPGVNVLAGRSAALGTNRSSGLLVRKSGTSMATPHVTGAIALCLQLAGHRLSAREIRTLVLASCDSLRSPDPEHRLGRGYLNIPRLISDVRRTLMAREIAPSTKESTMDSDDTMLVLEKTPGAAYREYVYRPGGRLARWIDERYDVLARPGQRVARAPRRGDVLIEITLGHAGSGRCVPLDGRDLEIMGSRRRLPHGQLLLRPLPRVESSESMPVEPMPVEPMPVEPAGEAEDAELDRLIDQGLSENQITNALFYARHPAQSGAALQAGTRAAHEWQSIRVTQVRAGVRQRLVLSPIDPVQLAVFLSQYENDSRVPAEYTKRFLTGTPLLSMGRTLRDRVIGNWRIGKRPLTALGLYELAFETAGDPGTAELLCHNVTKAFVREGVAITWRGTGTEGEYTDGQKTYTAKVINSAGRLKYFHGGKRREVISIFYLLFSAKEFGTDDPGDWYHYFVTATMTALSSGGTLGATTSRGRREDVEGDADGRGGQIGPTVYRGLLSDRVVDLEKQMTDSALASVPGYRGWVLANVLSFLEGGHYGTDYTTGQSDVVRESKVHLRGAAFGLRTIGGFPGKTWRWYVPVAGSLSDADLAMGFTLKDKTAEAWGPDAKPAAGEAVDPDLALGGESDGSAEDKSVVAPHVKVAQEAWTRLFGKNNVLNKVTIIDYENVPSDAVKEQGYDAWTNSKTRIYIAQSANANPVTLDTTLRHEAVHVGQFAKQGRPNSYEKAMRYELEAYRETLARLQDRLKVLTSVKNRSKTQDDELKTVDDLCTRSQEVVDLLDEGIKDGVNLTKTSSDREQWYRHFLISRCLLPYHRKLLDLYEPPKGLRNTSAQESLESPYGGSETGPDGVEAYGAYDVGDDPGAFEADYRLASGFESERDSLVASMDGAELVGELLAEGFADSAEDLDDQWTQDFGPFTAAEFIGPEHKAIGDAGSGRESSSIPFGNPHQPLSFGDVVSMAGDYFETYDEMRDLATTAVGRTELEWARWHCLGLKRQGVPEPRTTEEVKKNVVDRYLLLAGRNLSHFSAGGTAWQAYSLWHGKAIADALEAGQASNQTVWRRALTKEAFGDHFLTDMFSAGHVRTPRAEIRDWYNRHFAGTSESFISYMAKYIFDRLDERQQLPPLLWWVGWLTKSIMADRIRALGGEAVKSFSLGDIVALALHDQDNKGLVVVSEVDHDGQVIPGGYTWTAVGDGHLGRSAHGAETNAMATAAVIASLRDLERIRGVAIKLGNSPATLAQKTGEIREALGPAGFAARAFVPRESKVAGANVPLTRSDRTRAPLEWRWGQLGDAAFGAVDETVKGTIASELHAMAENVKDPISAPLGMRVYGTRSAFLSFVRHLHTDGIAAIEKAVGKAAR